MVLSNGYGHSRPTSQADVRIAQIVNHDRYYLRGGDVTFNVENTLFRVHRYFFDRESSFFKNKLCSVAPGGTPVGASDANAFMLENVTALDFSRFLWVFYNPKYSLYDATLDEWVSILRLAHQWQFSEVKALVVRELEKMAIDTVPKITIYQQHEVDRNLLTPSFAALCTRPEPISLSEGQDLGLETSLLIAKAREQVRAESVQGGDRLFAIIREVFAVTPPAVRLEVNGNGIHAPSAMSPPPKPSSLPTAVVFPRKTVAPAKSPAVQGVSFGNPFAIAAPPPPAPSLADHAYEVSVPVTEQSALPSTSEDMHFDWPANDGLREMTTTTENISAIGASQVSADLPSFGANDAVPSDVPPAEQTGGDPVEQETGETGEGKPEDGEDGAADDEPWSAGGGGPKRKKKRGKGKQAAE